MISPLVRIPAAMTAVLRGLALVAGVTLVEAVGAAASPAVYRALG